MTTVADTSTERQTQTGRLRTGLSEQAIDRIGITCSHLGFFAFGSSFGISVLTASIAPLCQPTALTAAPCAPVLATLHTATTAGLVGGAVLILSAVALSVFVAPEDGDG